MAQLDYYYFGQGKVWSRRLTPTLQKWRWWGDVSELTAGFEVEKVSHKESYSGNKGLARDFAVSKALKLSAKLHQIDTAALVEQVYGSVTAIASGSVVAEVLPTVVVGDVVKLDFGGVSALSIVDSAGTPVAFGAVNYELDPRFGSIEILTLPGGIVQPLKASYTHTAGSQLALLTTAQPILQFRYEGINLAESNAPVIFECYRVGTEPLKDLALITSGTDVAGVTIDMAGLIDSSKSASGALGQFGRFIQLPAA